MPNEKFNGSSSQRRGRKPNNKLQTALNKVLLSQLELERQREIAAKIRGQLKNAKKIPPS